MGRSGGGGNLQPDDTLRGSADEVSLYTKVFNQRGQSFLYACIYISIYIYIYDNQISEGLGPRSPVVGVPGGSLF